VAGGISGLRGVCRRVFNRPAMWIEYLFPLLLVAFGFCLGALGVCVWFCRETGREIEQYAF
jgi:hypothetical protein